MKKLMKSNIYDVNETIIIVGSCLKQMQPIGFEKLLELSKAGISAFESASSDSKWQVLFVDENDAFC